MTDWKAATKRLRQRAQGFNVVEPELPNGGSLIVLPDADSPSGYTGQGGHAISVEELETMHAYADLTGGCVLVADI